MILFSPFLFTDFDAYKAALQDELNQKLQEPVKIILDKGNIEETYFISDIKLMPNNSGLFVILSADERFRYLTLDSEEAVLNLRSDHDLAFLADGIRSLVSSAISYRGHLSKLATPEYALELVLARLVPDSFPTDAMWYLTLGWLVANTKRITATIPASAEPWFTSTFPGSPYATNIVSEPVFKLALKGTAPESLASMVKNKTISNTTFIYGLIKHHNFSFGDTLNTALIMETVPEEHLPIFMEAAGLSLTPKAEEITEAPDEETVN
jgi:hypothetical protein